MAGSTGDKKLCLMLIGKTGQGKSATGNTILGRNAFKQSSNAKSETKDIECKFTRFDNFSVKVLDCPGLMDTAMDSGKDKTYAGSNMATALGMCDGGVDAFILVIKRERFTEENRKSLEALKKIFGDGYMKYLIVVVVGGDTFKEDMEYDERGNISFTDWCSQQEGAFETLYKDCTNRFLLINNREKDVQKNEAQRREIIQLADNLREQNGRYTSQSFEEAKATRDKLIVKENLPMLNESLQKKVGLLSDALLKLKTAPSAGERNSILQSLKDLKIEIIEKDKGTGLLNHLMANVQQVENALHDVEQLHSLANKMENIREEKSSWSRFRKTVAGYGLVASIGGLALTSVAAVVAAPVVVGAALVGATIAATGGAVGVVQGVRSIHEEINLSTSEQKTADEIKALDTKVTQAIQGTNK